MNAIYTSRSFGADKRRAWEAVVSQLYASMEVRVRGMPEFEGEITHCLLDDLDLTHVIADYEIASRTRSHIARDVRQSCVFLFVRNGPMTLEQFGREALLDSHSCSLVDLGSPYVLKHSGVTDTFFLKAAEVVLRSKFKNVQSHCAVARPIGTGMGRIAADLIASLVQNAGDAGDEVAARLAAQILDILALAFEAGPGDLPEGPSLAKAAVRRRALAYIDRRISDTALDPAMVAAAIGVSTRYLHRVFESSEQSVGTYIRARRLERARADLVDEKMCRRSISEIALRNGFANQSSFATTFKKEFGVSPRNIRAAAQPQDHDGR
jgi:AraC family transcriptional regulator, positive regulator of tynA and feaB